MRRLSRPALIALIALGLVLFLVISAVLARVFSVDSAERAALTSLVQAEARGDAAGMVRQMHNCDSFCQLRVQTDAQSLKRPGQVQIAEINVSAGFAFVSTTGTARIAWFARDVRPVVQCVRVRRAGNAITGFTIQLLRISFRIPSAKDCPKNY